MAMGAILGVCALIGTARIAAADNAFVPGSMWRGFSQSNLTDNPRGMTILHIGSSSQDGYLIALLFVEGKWRQVKSIALGDGSVDLLGIGPDKGLHAHGHTLLTGDGSYFAHLIYQMDGSVRGYFDLLRAFPPGPTVNGWPPDPYRTAFPAGPSVSGKYTRADGASGRLSLTHDPSTESGPPAFFTGNLMFQDFHFNIVGAISANRLTDGGYPVEMLGQSALFSKSGPSVHVSGELVPAVHPGDHAHLRGVYSVMNADGNVVDRGAFDMAF
jgi:hypothetical protein